MTDNPLPAIRRRPTPAQLFHLAYDRLRTRIYGRARDAASPTSAPPTPACCATSTLPDRGSSTSPSGRHDETEHGLSDR